ncbi:MAG: tRNA threonylcarbamoyladenosine dehydratase [Prevotella sp.]
MESKFSRTEMLLGHQALEVLRNSRVAVFGVGGVGSYAVEVLARSGVGAIDIFDNDVVSPSNINRQLIALETTVGRPKVEVAAERIRAINSDCRVTPHQMFYLPERAAEVDLRVFDYVVDCIDTVKAKMDLACRCHELGVPMISSMGAANKLDATRLCVTDLYKTKMDPIAKIMRKKLRKLGVTHLKVVYSDEEPLPSFREQGEVPSSDMSSANDTAVGEAQQETASHTRPVPASVAFVPGVAGLIIGGEVVKDLISIHDSKNNSNS